MEKVYVLVHEWQFDSGENGMEVEVFENFEKAQARREELIDESIVCWDEFFSNGYELERGKECVSFFECGEYCYNHENILVYEKQVK